MNADGAVSTGSGHTGALLGTGVSRTARAFSLSVSATWASPKYRDIAAENSAPIPRLQLNAGAGLALGRYGSISAAYNLVDSPAPTSTAGTTAGNSVAQRARLVSASYSVQFGSMSLYANGFRDLISQSTGFMAGLTIPLGIRSSVTASGVLDSWRPYGQIESSQSAIEIGDFGYQLYAAEGSRESHEFATGQYKSPWALVTAGVDRTSGSGPTYRLEGQGAVSVIDGTVFPSPPISDAFAVVDTNGLAGVHVLRENRIVGQTGPDGRIFIPDLRSFEVNHLAIDPNDIPPDTALSSATHDVRPQDRTGVVVPFEIRRSNGALLRLVHESGEPVAFGSAATLGSSGKPVPVGYDGEAYVEDLDLHNELTVTEPNGARCVAMFEYLAKPGDVPEIGPVLCRSVAQ